MNDEPWWIADGGWWMVDGGRRSEVGGRPCTNQIMLGRSHRNVDRPRSWPRLTAAAAATAAAGLGHGCGLKMEPCSSKPERRGSTGQGWLVGVVCAATSRSHPVHPACSVQTIKHRHATDNPPQLLPSAFVPSNQRPRSRSILPRFEFTSANPHNPQSLNNFNSFPPTDICRASRTHLSTGGQDCA